MPRRLRIITINAGKLEFRDAAIVLSEPTDGVYPSDHRGVMVDVVQRRG